MVVCVIEHCFNSIYSDGQCDVVVFLLQNRRTYRYSEYILYEMRSTIDPPLKPGNSHFHHDLWGQDDFNYII